MRRKRWPYTSQPCELHRKVQHPQKVAVRRPTALILSCPAYYRYHRFPIRDYLLHTSLSYWTGCVVAERLGDPEAFTYIL